MTPKQRDDLAGELWYCKACKSVRNKSQLYLDPTHTENHWTCSNLMCGGTCCQIRTFDDCQPLFAEIERRGLWEEFDKNLDEIRNFEYRIPAVRYYLGQTKPADIMAAFRTTIEEADGKEGA